MLVILSGVAGSGKDTIKKELINRSHKITTQPSFTDRPPREGEVNGEIYHFVSTEEFEKMIKNDDLYEYSVHHNHYYGTAKKVLDDKMASGKIIVKDIDVNGTEDLIKIFKGKVKLLTIFLKVPKETLKERLINRGDTPKDIEIRLSRLEYEESKVGIYDYVMPNNDLEKTVQIIMKIIESEYER